MRIDKAAVFCDCAQPVGISIGGESGLAILANDGLLQQGNVRKNGFRVNTGKCLIDLTANFDVVNAGVGEDAFQHSATGTVHAVDGKFEVGFLDGSKIDELLQRHDIGSFKVSGSDTPAGPLQAWSVERGLN